MKRPDGRQLDMLFGSLRSGLRDMRSMQDELAQAIETERRCGNSRPDGFGPDNGRPLPADGPGIARAAGYALRDPHRDSTLAAVRALEDAVVALQRLRTHLGKLDALRAAIELQRDAVA